MSFLRSAVLGSVLAATLAAGAGSARAGDWYRPPPPGGRPVWGPEGKTGAAFMGGQWESECGMTNPGARRVLSIYRWNPAWITAQCWYVPCPPGTFDSGGACQRKTGPIRAF